MLELVAACCACDLTLARRLVSSTSSLLDVDVETVSASGSCWLGSWKAVGATEGSGGSTKPWSGELPRS